MLNILITGAGTITAQNVIRALKDYGNFRIIVTDVNRREMVAGAYFADAFYRIPYGVDKEFIPALLSIVKKEKIDVFIPILDEELLDIAKNKKRFEKAGAKLIISSPSTIEKCNDKYKMYLEFKKNRITTPETFLPSQSHKIKKSVFPLIVKPRFGKGSVGVQEVFDREGLYSILKQDTNVIIQEYINGKEYTIDTFSDGRNEVRAVVPRLRLEVKAGVSYKGRTIREAYLIKAAARIVKFLHIFGPANLQCIKSRGKFYFIEVNPRFSGGLALTVRAGVNTPLMAIALALGQDMPRPVRFKDNLNMVRYVSEIFF